MSRNRNTDFIREKNRKATFEIFRKIMENWENMWYFKKKITESNMLIENKKNKKIDL